MVGPDEQRVRAETMWGVFSSKLESVLSVYVFLKVAQDHSQPRFKRDIETLQKQVLFFKASHHLATDGLFFLSFFFGGGG